MSVTLGRMQEMVADALSDPDHKAFSTDALRDFVNAGIAEVSAITPEQFQEDIPPEDTFTLNALSYQLRASQFSSPVKECEVAHVEVWDTSSDPTLVLVVQPATSANSASSQTGWVCWGGMLHLPVWIAKMLVDKYESYILRVWGYSPYPGYGYDVNEVSDITDEMKWAVVDYCRVLGLKRLLAERDLFTQWQTRPGNSDITPAGLMNALSLAQDDWRRRKSKLLRLRSNW